MQYAKKLSVLLRRHLRELDRLRQGVVARGDADDIHDLRVLTRRLRSLGWAADRITGRSKSRRFRRALRKLGRALSLCRAIDVAGEDAPAELRAPLAEWRAREFERVRRAVRSTDASVRGRKWATALRRFREERPDAGRFAELADYIDRRPGGTSKPALHEYRIKVKKCRYVLETLHRIGLMQDTPHERLRKVQSALGRAHDLEVLRRYFRKFRLGRLCPSNLQAEEKARIRLALRLASRASRPVRRALSLAARRLTPSR